jgi:hypothetical protein
MPSAAEMRRHQPKRLGTNCDCGSYGLVRGKGQRWRTHVVGTRQTHSKDGCYRLPDMRRIASAKCK